MSVTASTVPAAKVKLLELFRAKFAGETSVEVWAARTAEDHQEAENIYLGQARGTREFKLVGRQLPNGREEHYTVVVEVDVYRDGTDIEGAEARLFAVVANVEAVVAENPELPGVTGVQWIVMSDFVQETLCGNDGVLSKAMLGVTVTARI